jgi:hypothetical protein
LEEEEEKEEEEDWYSLEQVPTIYVAPGKNTI